MSFDNLLIHRATIHRMTETGRDEYNNAVVEETKTYTGVDARFDAMDATEQIRDRDQQTQRFTVFLRPIEGGVFGTDELTWEDPPDGSAGWRLKLEGDPLATYDTAEAHHLELFAYRIRG